MKKTSVAAIILLPATASTTTLAQSDFALTFDIPDGVNCTAENVEGNCNCTFP